jgi:NAD-dependent dihydropyrimidine dehydrogenase PreA subunit
MSTRYLAEVVTLTYDPTRCNGCRRCVEVCPHAVFSMHGKKAELMDRDACMECGACAKNCAAGAISVRSGVGCAQAIIMGKLYGAEPTCGCGDKGACC